jgi:energy-coupling factor transporter ATP-binding protein EcfA2
MLIDHPGHINGKFHIDDDLYNNLIELPKRIGKNKDCCILIVGDPGNGKSTLTSQLGYILNPNIITQNCFITRVEDFKNYQLNLLKTQNTRGEVIVHDEAREAGSLNLMTKKIKAFWDLIYENRFLNMYQFFIQSDFFRTPRDIIFHRAIFMIWVIEDSANWNNGIFLFYSKKDMKRLYLRGKMQKDYSHSNETFKGRFVSFWAGNPNYLESKENNFIKKYTEKEENKKDITQIQVVKWLLRRWVTLGNEINDFPAMDLERQYNINHSVPYTLKKEIEFTKSE